MNEIAKRIKQIVDRGLAPSLRQAGFRRNGMSFHRLDGEALHVVNVQSSQWNSRASGKFTINVAVDFADVTKLLPGRQPMPTIPKEYCCVLRMRVGNLMPDNRDHWWTVTPETQDEHLTAELMTVWTDYIAPWLEKFRTVSSIAENPNQGALQNVFAQAAANIILGDRAKAGQQIEAQIRRLHEDPAYLQLHNAKLKDDRLTMFRNWAADQGLTITHDYNNPTASEKK
jgi:hypothetical protein